MFLSCSSKIRMMGGNEMKRFCVLLLAIGLVAPVGLVGCSDESKTETEIHEGDPRWHDHRDGHDEDRAVGREPAPPTGVSGEPAPAPNP